MIEKEIQCLYLLKEYSKGGDLVKGRDLAEEMEVVDREVRRYFLDFSQAGLKIETIRGPYGGYRLTEDIDSPFPDKLVIEYLKNMATQEPFIKIGDVPKTVSALNRLYKKHFSYGDLCNAHDLRLLYFFQEAIDKNKFVYIRDATIKDTYFEGPVQCLELVKRESTFSLVFDYLGETYEAMFGSIGNVEEIKRGRKRTGKKEPKQRVFGKKVNGSPFESLLKIDVSIQKKALYEFQSALYPVESEQNTKSWQVYSVYSYDEEELLSKILSLGSGIIVLEPKALKEKYVKTITKMYLENV